MLMENHAGVAFLPGGTKTPLSMMPPILVAGSRPHRFLTYRYAIVHSILYMEYNMHMREQIL